MASTPIWKVYRGREYVAACKYAEDAAALVALMGDDGVIKYDHRLVVWREGCEVFSASESYDGARDIMTRRVAENKGI